MKLDVPYYKLDLTPSQELTSFDFDSIDWAEWTKDTSISSFKPFQELVYIKFIATPINFWGRTLAKEHRTIHTEYLPIFPFIMNEIERLENFFNASAMNVALDGLPSGAIIRKHADRSPIFSQCHRVHLPLVTHPDVKFYIDDVEYHWSAGSFYEFDNQRIHEVKNNSNIFRIHLLVDLLPNN